MPRHPPIALKTLDRSHCQCPPQRNSEGIVASCALPRERRLNQILCGTQFDVIGTKRPASRDRFEGAVRQTHHMQGIERPLRQITNLSAHEVRTNLLFTMSKQNRRRARSSPQTFLRMTFSSPPLNTLLPGRSGGAGRDRTDDILLAKQALSQLSYGP